MKTLEQVKKDFRRRGETVTGWAKKNGFKSANVRAVMNMTCYRIMLIHHAVSIKVIK